MALMRRALAAAAGAGDERARGRIASDLATLHAERDAHADALEYLGQVLSAARRIGDRWLIAICIATLPNYISTAGSTTRRPGTRPSPWRWRWSSGTGR